MAAAGWGASSTGPTTGTSSGCSVNEELNRRQQRERRREDRRQRQKNRRTGCAGRFVCPLSSVFSVLSVVSSSKQSQKISGSHDTAVVRAWIEETSDGFIFVRRRAGL